MASPSFITGLTLLVMFDLFLFLVVDIKGSALLDFILFFPPAVDYEGEPFDTLMNVLTYPQVFLVHFRI